MNFYEYDQTNSGGEFVVNTKLARRVFIEARTNEKSKEKAFKLGIYFDGVADGKDCHCCGDRWCEAEEKKFPYRYSTFEKKKAEEIADKYNVDFGKTTFKFMNTEKPDPNRYDVVFRDVVSYATYLKDNFGSENPDAYIYYANGKKVKI